MTIGRRRCGEPRLWFVGWNYGVHGEGAVSWPGDPVVAMEEEETHRVGRAGAPGGSLIRMRIVRGPRGRERNRSWPWRRRRPSWRQWRSRWSSSAFSRGQATCRVLLGRGDRIRWRKQGLVGAHEVGQRLGQGSRLGAGSSGESMGCP